MSFCLTAHLLGLLKFDVIKMRCCLLLSIVSTHDDKLRKPKLDPLRQYTSTLYFFWRGAAMESGAREEDMSKQWRSEWVTNRSRLSPWLQDCLTLEFEDNLHGMHDMCHCPCGRCYQLTWLRKPQHCNCTDNGRRRYLGLDDKIRARRRRCRCNPSKKVEWRAWFCHRCTEVCEMTATGPCIRKREITSPVLDNLEDRILRGYATSGSSDTHSDSTSYVEHTVYTSSEEDEDSATSA